MPSPSINADIKLYKSQLDDFLSKKFVDQSLLLGFTAVIQSKFHKWISEDANNYYQVTHNGVTNAQPLEFALIDLFDALWGKLHHPIIKFFQRQHADLYMQLADAIKNKKELRAVEMRKLNECFNKYIKAARTFYLGLLQHLVGRYQNKLVPNRFLEDVDITLGTSQLETTNSDFTANLTFMMYHCLLALGNLARHSTQIYLTYVVPCKSVSNYYKHLKSRAGTSQKFSTALLFYSKCMGLLPALNEPYNHMGVIYNSVGERFKAVMWFLRSLCTRIPNYAVGKVNFATVLTKPWLEEESRVVSKKLPAELKSDDVNVMLLRILAHHFYPAEKRTFLIERAEAEFFGVMFLNPEMKFAQNDDFIQDQLTVLICSYSMAESEISRKRFGWFLVKYFAHYLREVARSPAEEGEQLKNIRLILAFLRKNRNLIKEELFEPLVAVINRAYKIWEMQADIVHVEDILPTRSYYFSEDVLFKDFLPIGFQFKDYDDLLLFRSGDVSLLFGPDYYINAKDQSDNAKYLDNNEIQKVMKGVVLSQRDKVEEVKRSRKRTENLLRMLAIHVMVQFDLCLGRIESAEEGSELKVTEKPLRKDKVFEKRILKKEHPSQKASKKPSQNVSQMSQRSSQLNQKSSQLSQNSSQKETYATQLRYKSSSQTQKSTMSQNSQGKSGQIQVQNTQSPVSNVQSKPVSLEEIELIIAGHALKLAPRELISEMGLADMVNSIVSEKESESQVPDSQGSHVNPDSQVAPSQIQPSQIPPSQMEPSQIPPSQIPVSQLPTHESAQFMPPHMIPNPQMQGQVPNSPLPPQFMGPDSQMQFQPFGMYNSPFIPQNPYPMMYPQAPQGPWGAQYGQGWNYGYNAYGEPVVDSSQSTQSSQQK